MLVCYLVVLESEMILRHFKKDHGLINVLNYAWRWNIESNAAVRCGIDCRCSRRQNCYQIGKVAVNGLKWNFFVVSISKCRISGDPQRIAGQMLCHLTSMLNFSFKITKRKWQCSQIFSLDESSAEYLMKLLFPRFFLQRAFIIIQFARSFY